MNAPQSGVREIAIGLAESLRPALVPGAPAVAIVAARDVAQLMGLSGLDAALAQLARHETGAWPLDVEHVAARVARMAETAASEGDLRIFSESDRDLAMLAAQLAAIEWSEPANGGERGVATIAVGEAFADLALDAGSELLRTRVTLTVASAVRAAVDWLGAEDTRRVSIESHDSALTLTLEVTNAGGIGPAGAVLAAVEGSLGCETDGRWTIRVATAAERGSFLLLRQGRFGIALPWHAVARLRMFAPHELDRLVEPRLAPLTTGPAVVGERPAALVALGLARAWFVADRIVWRIAARPAEAPVAGPFAGSSRAIEVESGERYWLLEPAWLLRGVAPPDSPPPSPRPRTTALVPEAPRASRPVASAPPANESLADAVERALATLRTERAAAPDVQVPPPAPPAPPAPPMLSPEAAADAVMFSATVNVMRPASEDATPEAVPQSDAPPAPTPSLDDAAVAGLLDALTFAAPAAPVAPAPTPAPPAPLASAPAPASAPPVSRPAVRRALVADDSLVARIFLARLLEKRGWIVETVADAASMWDELHRGTWGLVCADVALPDAQGAPHVSRLVQFLAQRGTSTPMIVLTRDAIDEHAARGAGASLVLRKPFAERRLEELLGH